VEPVVIAGAGIIGLSTALELAARGHDVVVLERGKALQEASWAAAGMLAADDPDNPPALGELARSSLALYPEYLARIHRLSGHQVRTQTTHTLQLIDSHKAADSRKAAPALAEKLSCDEAARRVPGLKIAAGLSPIWLEEQSLDPRELCLALAAAARGAGVEIRENAPFLSVSAEGPEVAIHTPEGTIFAKTLIVATGAWNHVLPEGTIRPRKGQMLRLKKPAHIDLKTVLRSREIYIVPRANGSLVVGATVEDAGFHRDVRVSATEWILAEAARLWTPIADLTETMEEVWTGLRPASADGLPVLGSVDDPRILFATGHYRNGILLAPGTARLIAQLVCGETPDVDLSQFDPGRFVQADRFGHCAVPVS
jgi:glycine oxidase